MYIMVSSKINGKVNYTERKTLDDEDFGHTSTLYLVELYDIPTVIVLGKQKYTYSAKDIVYYPIYVISENKIKSQIGVYETRISKALKLVDEDGDIDIEKMDEPLLYSFVNERFIQKINTNNKTFIDELLDRDHTTSKEKDTDEEDVAQEKEQSIVLDKKSAKAAREEEEELDALKLKVRQDKVSSEKQKTDAVIEKGIFTIDTGFKLPATLEEETEPDADKIKLDFKESSRNTWIEKFMKNNHYDIVETDNNGDCFFDTIRKAFETMGQRTTIEKLRSIVASNLTDDIYQENRRLYNDFENQKNDIKTQLKDLKHANDIYAKRMKTLEDKAEREKLIQETKQIKKTYGEKMKDLKDVTRLQDEYVGPIKNIDSLEKYRSFILTSSYWADSWAISTLERVLKIKVIIFSEEAYKNKAYDNVLNCGEVNKELEKQNGSDFDPKFYVMATYSGDHYKLITYKHKSLITFREIPYDVKILIMNKCLERNSGVYYLIQDFRNFKSRLGLEPDEGNPDLEDEDDDETHSHLYNNSVVFVYHSKSLDNKPGKGSNEKIDKDRRGEFAVLSKIPDWRRKLDDMWSLSPFMVDKHRWASVEHYIQAAKFKKGFPDFYEQFSLDNPSELSQDPEMARMAGDTTKSKYKELRPKNVKIDTDYNLGRAETERETAVMAKFSQNEDMKQLLLSTQDALLKKYLRRKPSEKDAILMKVRYDLRPTK